MLHFFKYLVHVNHQDAAVALERVLSAVPVMGVEVHDGNAFHLVRAVDTARSKDNTSYLIARHTGKGRHGIARHSKGWLNQNLSVLPQMAHAWLRCRRGRGGVLDTMHGRSRMTKGVGRRVGEDTKTSIAQARLRTMLDVCVACDAGQARERHTKNKRLPRRGWAPVE